MSTPSSVPPDRWDAPPLAVSRTWYPVVRPTPERHCRVVVVCPRMVGRWGHYEEGSHWLPCDAPAPCPFSHDGRGYRWYGWLGCFVLESPNPRHMGRLGLLEITAGVICDEPWLWSPELTLRGEEIILARSSASRGRVYLKSHRHLSQKLKDEPFDVRAALCRVWGYVPGCVIRPRMPAFDPPSPVSSDTWDDHAPPL